ncbi:hypothetical protein HELRODRAFT_168379 [Helobdella robusta]|uniref:Uncharacterized protein n=1 Tax=Helobdella robusta TaxID=6412 RepID=T1F0I4_HELRO|nr:hypothetical protein HELRODRAFT_168379 [Helobdella robusta]ESO09397.1 hypothetical protein HELRODRAFT_168379 [Helobdella robusta]
MDNEHWIDEEIENQMNEINILEKNEALLRHDQLSLETENCDSEMNVNVDDFTKSINECQSAIEDEGSESQTSENESLCSNIMRNIENVLNEYTSVSTSDDALIEKSMKLLKEIHETSHSDHVVLEVS